MLVVQVMVVVLGEVVGVLDVGAAANDAVRVVHVHEVRLAVLRVVVEDGGQVGDGRWVWVGVRVGVGVLERVRRQGAGRGHR